MTSPATVEGGERLRLFCALTLPDDVLDVLERWQRDDLRGDARALRRDQLHLTLAFLGHRPVGELAPIAGAVEAAAAVVREPLVLSPSR